MTPAYIMLQGSVVLEPGNMVPRSMEGLTYTSAAATATQEHLVTATAGLPPPYHMPMSATPIVPVPVRTPMAYKRPLSTPRKVLGTPTVALSPRATPTPPHKIIVGPGQRLMPKPMMRECDYLEYSDHQQRELATPLTPPATPEVTSLRGWTETCMLTLDHDLGKAGNILLRVNK